MKHDFLEGRLRFLSDQDTAQLAAHIAQAELGNYNDAGHVQAHYPHLLPQTLVQQHMQQQEQQQDTGGGNSSGDEAMNTEETTTAVMPPNPNPNQSSNKPQQQQLSLPTAIAIATATRVPPPTGECSSSLDQMLAAVATEHARLRGMTASAAQYHLLRVAAEMPCYGMDYFQVGSHSVYAYLIKKKWDWAS